MLVSTEAGSCGGELRTMFGEAAWSKMCRSEGEEGRTHLLNGCVQSASWLGNGAATKGPQTSKHPEQRALPRRVWPRDEQRLVARDCERKIRHERAPCWRHDVGV